jgi:hypothetical protein|uniref:Minor capsid protein P8 central region domain-containing protein n=1 Tax=viral metagenome TaxID=1070528 RepID=A0A6C0BXQ0_9ZZZZ
MFSNVNFNGRVNLIDQPNTDTLFGLYDKNKSNKTSFRDALKGVKQDNNLSLAFFSKENLQIIQNGLRAGVHKMSQKKYVIAEQSYDNIKLIMQDAYYEHALNHPTNIASQIDTINHKIFEKYVPRLYGEYVGYINYRNDASTIKEPMFYPKQSGDKDFKNLEYKKW